MSTRILKMKLRCIGTVVCLLSVSLVSCKKFITLDNPPGALGEEATFSTEGTATAALLDAYSNVHFFVAAGTSTACVMKLNAMYTDEYRLTASLPELMALNANALDATSGPVRQFWTHAYGAIYKVNAFIESIEKYGGEIASPTRNQLIGEARFLRAFCYFNLVNTYGDVPLLLTSNYEQNARASRTPQAEVYAQIERDLLASDTLLHTEYLTDKNVAGTARIRPNKDVSKAMLARVYLFMNRWDDARKAATAVIDKSGIYSLETDLTRVFHTTSKEAIFQLPANFPTSVTSQLVGNFLLTGPPTTSGSGTQIGVLNDSLVNSFEAGDKRRSDGWVGSVTSGGKTYLFPGKYRSYTTLTQYMTCLRLAELYLIRAEANINLDQVATGIDDLNIIRKRARAAASVQVPTPLPDLVTTLSKRDALLALEQERKVELFTEGHRWFDLRRWKGIDNPALTRAEELMPAIAVAKGGTWEKYKLLFPIPQTEVLVNTNLKQNDEY